MRRLGFFVYPTALLPLVSNHRMNAAKIKNMAILMLLCLVAVTFSQSAVRLRGRVLDAVNGQPLPGANVQVMGTGAGAATSASGRFEIENLLNGDYTVRISYMGYETAERRVAIRDEDPATLLVRLWPVVIQLLGVQVAAARDDHQPADGAIVLTRERIARTQTEDLGSLLKTVGGVQIVESDGKKTIQIRGARANQTLVLLDGVKLNDPVTGEVDLSQMPLHNVQKIEIKKGGAAEYGDGALGGVIRIFTLNGGEDHQSLSWQGGSFGYQNLHAAVGKKWQNFDISASGQSMKNPRRFPYRYFDPNAVELSGVRKNADVNSTSLFGRIGFNAAGHSASIKVHSFTSSRGTPGKVFYWTPYARVKNRRQAAMCAYDFSRAHWRFHANAGRTWHETESRNIRPGIVEAPFGSTPEFHFRSYLSSDNFDLLFEHRAASWLQSAIGLDAERLHFSDENLFAANSPAIGSADDRSYGAFIKQEFSYCRRAFQFTVTPVLRYDQARLASNLRARIERQWNPGLRLFWSHGSGRRFYLRAEANRAFRMPTFADLFYQDFRVQGKPDLAPEKSRNFEFAIGAQWTALMTIHFDATFFQSQIEDMIVWRLGSFEFFRPYNTDAELRGGEYSLQLSSAANRFSIDLFYSHLRALNKSNNQTLHNRMLPYRPQHSFKANLHFAGDHWQSSVGVRGVGRRFITEANTKVMPAHAVLDWSVEWMVQLRFVEMQWRLAILNALDERYQILRDMPQPGREWRVGLAIKVKAGS